MRKFLYEDDAFVAVAKQSGEFTIFDRFRKATPEKVLLHVVGEQLRAAGHKPDDSGRDLYPVHRLDKDTSGVVLFAKTAAAHRELSILFQDRGVKKTYWAFVEGAPIWDDLLVNLPIQREEGKSGRGRAIIHIRNGRPSVTRCKVLGRNARSSWIEAEPETGRLHQIRVHLKALGHPVLHDPLYGSEMKPKERLLLHAKKIEFPHPLTGNVIALEAPLDDKIREMVTMFKQQSRKDRA